MTTTDGALAILTVFVAGTLLLAVYESESLQGQITRMDQLAGKQAQASTTAGGGSGTSGTPTQPVTRDIRLYSYSKVVPIANGVNYLAFTFNGTVPGPTIFINQGDTVHFTLINNDTMAHSIDFHAAEIDWSTAYASILPGQNKSFSFIANYPGVFMYHCGTPPVLEHIANGMYGAIIVRPSNPLPAAPGGSYVLVESEFYTSMGPGGTYLGNYSKMLSATPDYVVFNGVANQYANSPLVVQPNQLVRLYLLNAGPSLWEAFHVIGALMDTVYQDGNPANVLHGMQTVSLAPSSGAIVDMYFTDPGGKNPFVNHAFAYASIGATGIFQVANGSQSSTTSTAASVAGPVVTIKAGSGLNQSSPGYSPATMTVVVGVNNTVTWVNKDSIIHTVTASDKSFNSGDLYQGDSFTWTFKTPGTYTYYCLYHPWMKGTIIVKG